MTTYSIRKKFRLFFYHFGLIARLPMNSFDFAFVTRNLCSIYKEICVFPLIDTLFSFECAFTFLTHNIFLATFCFPLVRGTIEFLNIAEQNTHFYLHNFLPFSFDRSNFLFLFDTSYYSEFSNSKVRKIHSFFIRNGSFLQKIILIRNIFSPNASSFS